MKKNKLLSILITLIMLISVTTIFGAIDANAASLAKPSVTLTNASTTSVKISWKKVTNAKKYTVYRSTKKSSGYKAIKTTTGTSYTNGSLSCGKVYYYKVKAINGSKSATSAVKSITAKPATVTLKVTKGCTFLTPNWTKSTGVTGYEVYSSTSKSGTYKKIKTTTSLNYKDSGLKFGTTKYYKVRGYKTVNKKNIYGAYSSIVSAKSYTTHAAKDSGKITKAATCTASGTKTNTCKYCSKAYTSTIAALGHSLKTTVIEPTCKDQGYTLTECTRNGCTYSTKTDYKETSEHSYTWAMDGENVFGTCKHCGDILNDDFGGICLINLDDKSVSQSYAAKFNKAGDKLTLKGDGYIKYEIIGSAKDFTIDVDVKDGIDPTNGKANELELKLCGASINNIDKNCIDIKDKTTDANGKAIISIKTDTENFLSSTTSGNAIDSSCALEIKGHGKLSINTTLTSIDCRGKIDIKNVTLNITSGNRGIDTKKEILNTSGVVVDTEFSNITIGTNANITINSLDDGIRCKNMEIEAKNPLAEPADVDSIIYIKAGSDGIQLEGKKGIEINSGKFTIIADKYAFNCSGELIQNNAGISLANCKGSKGLCKA